MNGVLSMIRVYKRNSLCYQIISKTLKEFESKFCGPKKTLNGQKTFLGILGEFSIVKGHGHDFCLNYNFLFLSFTML